MDATRIQMQHGTVRDMIGGGWLGVRPGEFTDDTQMTLAVAHGITEEAGDPIEAIGRHFVEWANSGPEGCRRHLRRLHPSRHAHCEEPRRSQ